jgi:hypothetical protein
MGAVVALVMYVVGGLAPLDERTCTDVDSAASALAVAMGK